MADGPGSGVDLEAYFDSVLPVGEPIDRVRSPQRRRTYATPAMRVCLDPITPDGDGRCGDLVETYSPLRDRLPLLGSPSLAPTADGGILLCERLREAMPWMELAIAAIERQLRVASWAGRPWIQWRPLCLVGPPGSGKSHFARAVGRMAGVPSAQLDLGGIHDSSALLAVSRGWNSTRPCWPVEMVKAFRCANPILALDEVDKAGGSGANGDAKQGLLAMLDAGSGAVYFDSCLLARVDLRGICWILTGNDASLLPAPLRSRLEVVGIDPPGPRHFGAALDGVVGALAARWRLPRAGMPDLPPRAIDVLRRAFARDGSMRNLERHVEKVLAALVRHGRSHLN